MSFNRLCVPALRFIEADKNKQADRQSDYSLTFPVRIIRDCSDAETLRRKDLKYSSYDAWLAKNTLLIIRDSLCSSSHDIVGYFLPATRR